MDRGWGRFNDQFRETTWKRNDRLRKASRAARCACGGNDTIGKPHAADCPNDKRKESTMPMVEIDGKLVNPEHIISAEVDTRHYMNGSSSRLIVKLVDGSRIEREHGYGFDAWATLDRIRGPRPAPPQVRE